VPDFRGPGGASSKMVKLPIMMEKRQFSLKKESNMEEKQIENVQNQNNKPETNKIVLPPKKGDPGYDAFMRRLFRSAASNMLRDDEI
jgi:hypothetical protein